MSSSPFLFSSSFCSVFLWVRVCCFVWFCLGELLVKNNFFKQKTTYHIRISECISEVCTYDLPRTSPKQTAAPMARLSPSCAPTTSRWVAARSSSPRRRRRHDLPLAHHDRVRPVMRIHRRDLPDAPVRVSRSA